MKKIILVFFSIVLFISQFSMLEAIEFHSGKPIWPERREREKNLFVGFRTVFSAPENGNVVLRITGSTLYRIFVNGNFCGYGPASGPHGFYRVDEWDISNEIIPGENLVAVEAAGYNINSYYVLDQPSFLQAEVLSEGKVLASTAGKGEDFDALILRERVQKVQRYSFQRAFSEVYRFWQGYDNWRKNISASFIKAPCSVLQEKMLLPRRVPYPEFSIRKPVWDVSCGKIEPKRGKEELWKNRSLTERGPTLKGFLEEELEVIPSIELQKISSVPVAENNQPLYCGTRVNLTNNSYHILDFGTNLTGFLGAAVTCRENTRLFFTFDEILKDGDVDFKRMQSVNIVSCEMPAGIYEIESYEPYTLRYLKLIVFEGECEIKNVHIREYVNPDVHKAHFAASDERLNRLFAAGRETFRQNALDIFMDCPSRERAGWLCDSYFTARAAFDLCGNTVIEKNFFENFLLPQKFAHLPEGMLPMCYPADHPNGVFIPNWALWFVIQFEEYLWRSGDRQTVEALKQKILNLFDYFQQFQNEDGLLENLESWVFVEWSEANKFVQDVNYPSNMLYAGALEAAGRMYDIAEFEDNAEKIRKVIRWQSFDGDFFVDNAVRKDGKLEVTRNRTEVCQYFAFYFNVAVPENHYNLASNLRSAFGPERKKTKRFPEIHEANAFIGNMLRLELLSRYGLCQQILDESISYFLYMANQTGTLWENVGSNASCNHGFASHIVHTLYRDVLGIYRIDVINKVIRLRFSDLELKWCEGIIPLQEGVVELKWRKEDAAILYQVNVPSGYSIKVENKSSHKLVRLP